MRVKHLLLLLALLLAVPFATAAQRPNVILILMDDMGWGDLSVNWTQQDKNGRQVTRRNEFKTPTLDTMATEGMQLRRHYSAAPVCAPARASLLLGCLLYTSPSPRDTR